MKIQAQRIPKEVLCHGPLNRRKPVFMGISKLTQTWFERFFYGFISSRNKGGANLGMGGLKSTLTTTALYLDKAIVPEKTCARSYQRYWGYASISEGRWDCEKINRVGQPDYQVWT